MSVISGETMERLIKSKELILEPFDKECLQPASIDLRAGGRAMKSSVIDERGMVVDLARESKTAVFPGQFAAVLTLEKLALPLNICGRVGLRSFYARKGLISFHGTQVDPGFSGHLVVPIVNMGPEPIILEYGKPFITLELNYLETASSKPYSGDYQDQHDFSLDDINFILRAPQAVSVTDVLGVRQDIAQLRETFSRRQPRLISFFSFILCGLFVIVGIISWRFFEPWTVIASLGVAATAFLGGIAFLVESRRRRT